MFKNLMKSIANAIDSIAYRVFGYESCGRKVINNDDVNHHRALLIVSKSVGVDYDFDYMEDE